MKLNKNNYRYDFPIIANWVDSNSKVLDLGCGDGELLNYLKKEIFDDANIKVIFERFEHPTYNQIHGKFIPNMSIIDLLFNEGGKAKKILEKSQNY